ncbi:MAG: class I SAM-dependent methyltransferase [Bdellovibrionales bacterium]|nr:class I SAM-dependent methyltransferase [Bdellovibrionales bacterium]
MRTEAAYAIPSLGLNSAKQQLFCLFERIKAGNFSLVDETGKKFQFGSHQMMPQAQLMVRHEAWYKRILSHGSLGLGDSYVDGWWEVGNQKIVDLLGVALLNDLRGMVDSSLALKFRLAASRFLNSPTSLKNAAHCVSYHYDLNNAFFKKMLGSSMTYSCGLRLAPEESLSKMQSNKHQLCAEKLKLADGGKLLDIGCGWGGFLFYIASNFPGVQAHGITLSRHQFEYVRNKIDQLRLKDRISVELLDYRKAQGKYDFVVSIGMFEHVGLSSYQAFMKILKNCLKKNGIGLLHTIGEISDLDEPEDTWISTRIFPGARLPRLDEISYLMRRNGLNIAHVENLRPHYADTLRCWRENVSLRKKEISGLHTGFDRRFFRFWDYYLQSTEAGFRYGTMQLYQVLFSHGSDWPFPMRLNYPIGATST